MIRPISLSVAHMECRSFTETMPVLIDLLAFERVSEGPNTVTFKHPNTPWLLAVHEGGAEAPEKPMHNHFGVRVEKKIETDAAWEYVNAHKDDYGLYELRPQEYNHGSYSIHFREPASNGWEIECYEDVLRKESGGLRLGGVRSRHWERPLPPERFPGRGYVPQGFTHGTLACSDAPTYGRFLSEVLGLEDIRATPHVTYTKAAAAKNYIVCLEQPHNLNSFSPNFRFTISVESPDAVETAHKWLQGSKTEFALRELGPMQTDRESASFVLRDYDANWWEIAAE